MAFEALRDTQRTMAETLERVLAEGMLPQTLLFSGHTGSSRLTAALDLAFLLTGEEDRREMLSSQHISLFLSRPLRAELSAASSLLLRQRNSRSRRFYLQSVRKVLMQYHQSVASLHREVSGAKGIRDERLDGDKSVSAAASLIDERLMAIEEEREYSESEIKEAVSEIDALLTDAVINVGKKTAGATIEEIRATQAWLHEGIDEKVVIFENPEDYAEGAKNSLLKLLEEPPEHAHLILLSKSPSRLLETILSRCRKFSFPELPPERISAFIAQSFSIYGSYGSFDEFFFEEGADEGERKAMEGNIEAYYGALRDGRMLPPSEEDRIFSSLEKSGGYRYFSSIILSRLEKALRDGSMGSGRARKLYAALSDGIRRSETYNMPMRISLDLVLREAEDVS